MGSNRYRKAVEMLGVGWGTAVARGQHAFDRRLHARIDANTTVVGKYWRLSFEEAGGGGRGDADGHDNDMSGQLQEGHRCIRVDQGGKGERLEKSTISPFDKPRETLKEEPKAAAEILETSQFNIIRRSLAPSRLSRVVSECVGVANAASACSHNGPMAAPNEPSPTILFVLLPSLLLSSPRSNTPSPVRNGAKTLLPPEPPNGFCTPLGTCSGGIPVQSAKLLFDDAVPPPLGLCKSTLR